MQNSFASISPKRDSYPSVDKSQEKTSPWIDTPFGSITRRAYIEIMERNIARYGRPRTESQWRAYTLRMNTEVSQL